jgi:hypothetical protein
MRRTSTAAGLLTLVTLVLGAVSAGSASAESFLWTGGLPGLLLVLSQNAQAFTINGSPLSFVCQHFGGHGILSSGPKGMSAKGATIAGTYSKCEAPALGAPVTVPSVDFLFNANGSLSIVGRPIVLTIPALGCSLKINNGGSSSLKTVKFLNLPQDISAHLELNSFAALGSGEPCGSAGEEKPVIYSGLLLISVDGGTIKWDP